MSQTPQEIEIVRCEVFELLDPNDNRTTCPRPLGVRGKCGRPDQGNPDSEGIGCPHALELIHRRINEVSAGTIMTLNSNDGDQLMLFNRISNKRLITIESGAVYYP